MGGATTAPLIYAAVGRGGALRLATMFGVERVLAVVPTLPLSRGGVGIPADHALTATAEKLFQLAGIPTLTLDGSALEWSSVLWSLNANALSAILDIPREAVYRSPEWFAVEYGLLKEALRVIDRLGVKVSALPGVNLPLMARQIRWIPRRLLPAFLMRHPAPPSLRDDLVKGSGRSEAAYYNGAVALAAHDLHLRTPINHALALTLTDIAEGRALWSQYKDRPERLAATLRLAQ